MTEPKFSPDVGFALLTRPTKNKYLRIYLIDHNTILDILAAMDCKTASQAYRRAKLLEILEQDTPQDRGAEKEVGL